MDPQSATNGRGSIRPIGQGLGKKSGTCRLCGRRGKLTKTHVPPRGAGNHHPARQVVQEIDTTGARRMVLGREAKGGMRGYWFCANCNGRTGKWDTEYITVHKHLLLFLHQGPEPPHERLIGELPHLDVGAFARSMWAWSFALNPTLLDSHPDIAESVRTGSPVKPPRDIDLLLALTPSLMFWTHAHPFSWVVKSVGPDFHQRPSGLLVPGPEIDRQPIVAVSSPPFNVMLAHADRPSTVPHIPITDWLSEPAGLRRDVWIDLPLVETVDDYPPLPPSYSDFRLASTLVA